MDIAKINEQCISDLDDILAPEDDSAYIEDETLYEKIEKVITLWAKRIRPCTDIKYVDYRNRCERACDAQHVIADMFVSLTEGEQINHIRTFRTISQKVMSCFAKAYNVFLENSNNHSRLWRCQSNPFGPQRVNPSRES